MDEKVFEKIEKYTEDKSAGKTIFPEHDFLAACLKIGLKIDDLKILTYIDILKIFISFLKNRTEDEDKEIKEATSKDIQNLVARM
ncbi:MAG TPA: hypothetical protein H9829_01430 [Candidatus Tetragenococcus pullicola]|nr:hypothetical protein [Candidatus Tetragenococcus pullicola]